MAAASRSIPWCILMIKFTCSYFDVLCMFVCMCQDVNIVFNIYAYSYTRMNRYWGVWTSWCIVRMNFTVCSVLRCVAVCCSVLQCVAVCCSVLQCGTASRWILPASTTSIQYSLVHRDDTPIHWTRVSLSLYICVHFDHTTVYWERIPMLNHHSNAIIYIYV